MNALTPEAQAMVLFRAGRFAEAEQAWRAILERRPDDPQALHLLGYILARTGRVDAGLALMDRSVQRAPRAAPFLANRAQVLADAGRMEEALRDMRRAVQLEPRMAAGYGVLGSLLRRAGRLEEALAAFRRAISIEPRVADTHVGLANVLRERGDEAAARTSYLAALALDPGNPSAHYNFGVLLLNARDLANAEASFRRVLEREPTHTMALNNLGIVLRETGRADEALGCFERAVAADEGHVEALNNLALALQRAGRLDEAIARFEHAARLRPAFAPVLLNWGSALRERGDLERAAEVLARALAAQPQSPEAVLNAASVALDRGHVDDAHELYSRALALRPEWADAEYGLGQVALRRREFAAGWPGYERRFETHPPQAILRSFAIPRLTQGELGSARRVAVWSEQGLGDQLLFSTLLPELAQRGFEAVAEVDERLLAMYRRSLPAIEFATRDSAEEAFATCDHELPMGSLAALFRPDAASFAAQPHALLQPDAARVEAMRARLGAGRWIAISWRSLQGGERHALAERKSIPLEAFASLALVEGVRLLDVQYGDVDAERAAFMQRHPGLLTRLEDLDTYADLEGAAAAMAACERVITASNATAHLAGATGRPTHLLYRGNQPPFAYWAAKRDGRCLWYPLLEIVPGAPDAGWDALFEEVRRRIAMG